MSNHIQTLKNLIQDINNGDLESAGNKVSEYSTYIEHSMSATFRGRNELL